MDKKAMPDLTQTTPAAKIGPHPSWGDPEKVRWWLQLEQNVE